MFLMSSYKKNVYGVLNDKTKKMDSKSITDMVEGERRRWRHADIEGDDALNIVEFQVETSKAIFGSVRSLRNANVRSFVCLMKSVLELTIFIFLSQVSLC